MTRPLTGWWLQIAECMAGGTHGYKAIAALLQRPDEARKHVRQKVYGALLKMAEKGLAVRRREGGFDLTEEGARQLQAAEES